MRRGEEIGRGDGDDGVISGRYAYAKGIGLLLGLVIGVTLGTVAGALFVVLGVVLAFQNVATLLLAAFGGAILGVCIWLIADSGDGGFSRERDYIARYLMRVLEARPIDLPMQDGTQDSRKTGKQRLMKSEAPIRASRQ